MTSFTPGPWKWWTSNSWRRLKRDDRDAENVLEPTVCRSDNHPDLIVNEANMALIAAAPDLYIEGEQSAETLEEMGKIFRGKGFPGCGDICDLQAKQQRAALAKARGETTEPLSTRLRDAKQPFVETTPP